MHLGQNFALFLLTFVLALTAMIFAFFYNTEILAYTKRVLRDDEKVIQFFSVIYIVSGVLFIPLGIPTFFSGFVFVWKWGFEKGCPLCVVFNFFFWHLSHLAVFLLGRYFFFDFISKRWAGYKSLDVLKYAVRKHPAWIHFQLRATFLVPHTILTYTLAITEITLGQFLKGNWAVIIAAIPFVYSGVCIAIIKRDWYTYSLRQRIKEFENEE